MLSPAVAREGAAASRAGARPGLLLLALFAVSAAPIALGGVPAMVDYPNHLARMSVLARAGTAAANPFYEPSWALYPNLAMDLLVPPLARLVGVVEATRLFCVLAQALVVSGAAVLSWTVRRAYLGAGVTACIGLYSMPFAWGFVNFEFGLGVALWAIATWIALARGPRLPRLAAHLAFVPALYLSHLFALAIYGFVVGIWELHRAWSERRTMGEVAWTMGELAAPVFGGAIVAAHAMGSAGQSSLHALTWDPILKLVWPFGLNGFMRGLSVGETCWLAVIGYAVIRNGCLRFVRGGVWIAAALGLLFAAMPFGVGDTSFVDMRVLVAAALVLPAFVTVTIRSERWRALSAAAIGLLAAANLAAVASAQLHHQAEYRAMIASFRQIPPRSRVLSATYEGPGSPLRDHLSDALTHAPVLAVHFADAFVPTLFAYRGQQPIRTTEVGRTMAQPSDAILTTSMLAALARGQLPPDAPSFARSWRQDFDYLYVLRAGGADPLPGLIEPMTAGPGFALYRIRPEIRGSLP